MPLFRLVSQMNFLLKTLVIHLFFTFLHGYSNHTNNWAVIVDASRFWFNYRHSANALGVYRAVKRLGFPDSRIILMLPDDVACNARNPIPGKVFHSISYRTDLYSDDIEVDFRGSQVTPDSFLRVLSGRMPDGTPYSKKLDSDSTSNILIYLTGHGGDGFIKFQDDSEISGKDIADAIQDMHLMGRYNEILFIADTCQADTLFDYINSPNILAIGSSARNEDSFSYHLDPDIGVYVSDRFTYHAVTYLDSLSYNTDASIEKVLNICPYHLCHSTAKHRSFNFKRPLDQVKVRDFFGYTWKIIDESEIY